MFKNINQIKSKICNKSMKYYKQLGDKFLKLLKVYLMFKIIIDDTLLEGGNS